MVLYFSEREAHNRTKQELAELRAEHKAAQQAAERQLILKQQELILEHLRFLTEQVRQLRAESRARNGDDGNREISAS